jgi:probable selenium-dependent hydroxylase accessory protein YqeC
VALFSDHFDFSLPARVDFVGGGGKTGLILKLLEESSPPAALLYTTTTRIHPPHPLHGLSVISCDNEDYLGELLERSALGGGVTRKFVATRLPVASDLLAGLAPDFAERLDPVLFPMVLNEADGARSMSLKFPRANEPVLMPCANYLVPVIGLDCLNRPAGAQTIFRWEIASRSLGLAEGEALSPELAASVLLHPQGVCRRWKPGVRVLPFINKVDSRAEDGLADSLAQALLHSSTFPIERVVIGSVQNSRVRSVTA